MPGLSSPYRGPNGRQRSSSPLPPPVPAKPIDLNSSTRSTDKETGTKITRRAFLCDVVVEREGEEATNLLSHLGRPLAPLSTLPSPPPPGSSYSQAHTPTKRFTESRDGDDDSDQPAVWSKEKEEEMDQRLRNLIEELVRTEKSYLMRIQALKKNYADPLRNFARQEFSKIIPMYEAKALFANIDNIVPASALFSHDLDEMLKARTGPSTIGDLCLKHMKDLRTFDPYRTYLEKQDESQRMFQDVLKKYSSFASYIERTKYQTTGMGNIGLRELLMEPVQRIPRYTLLFQTMIKCMPILSAQRAKLAECIEIASRIAKCEPDPQTIRATVMYCLERNVDGFPANLFSNNRDFIDSIDVDDIPVDSMALSPPGSRIHSRPMSVMSASTSASTPSLASFGSSVSSNQIPLSPHAIGPVGQTLSPLHCTLFLFDDKLMIVKRQSHSISGRKVTGLDDVAKLVKSGGGVAVIDKTGARKDKLSYRGIVNVQDIIASDVGNGDFHLFFASPPTDQGDRWSLRQFRSYTAVQPPYGAGIDPVTIRRDKSRFLQNLWAAQALARTKVSPKQVDSKGVPRVLVCEDEFGLDAAGDMYGRAKCFWNVWDRAAWTNAEQKAKVAIHIDEDDHASELSLVDGDPCMIIKLQPMTGGLCRFSYATALNDGEGRALIDMTEVSERIVMTIHRYGIFKFRTSANSCPTTPSSTGHRLRPSLINLDAISRNLFGQASISSRSHTSSDMFSTTSSTRKSFSRGSTLDTKDSTSFDEQRRLARMSNSPIEAKSEIESPQRQAHLMKKVDLGQSEVDLNERLNLARRNSKTIAALSPASGRLAAKSVSELRSRVEEREEDLQRRSSKMAAKSVADLRRKDDVFMTSHMARLPDPFLADSPTPVSPTAPLRVRNKTPSPTRALERTPRALPLPISSNAISISPDNIGVSHRHTPSVSEVLSSSLPALPITSFSPLQINLPLSPIAQMTSSIDEVIVSSRAESSTTESYDSKLIHRASSRIAAISPISPTAPLSPRPQGPRSPVSRQMTSATSIGSARTKLRVVSGNGRRVSVGRETVPLKAPDENEASPQDTPTASVAKRQHSSEQLTPRKRSPNRSPLALRDEQDAIVPDPLRIPSGGVKKPQNRRTSGHNTPRVTSNGQRRPSGTSSLISQDTGMSASEVVGFEHKTAVSAVESAKRRIAESKAGVKRLKVEVHSLRKQLSHGSDGGRPTSTYSNSSLPRSPHRRNINRLMDSSPMFDDVPPSRIMNGKHELDGMLLDETARGLSAMVEKVEAVLRVALADSDQAERLVNGLLAQSVERDMEVKQLQAQVVRGKEMQEILRGQLADVQTEVDVIYEAFNTELDGMFEDTQLPQTQAFEAMQEDLKRAKSQRNVLALENMRLKRELEEANLKREQWSSILREKGLL